MNVRNAVSLVCATLILVASLHCQQKESVSISTEENKILVHRRIESGKIVEEWVEMDRLGLMQQMGVVPSPR